MDKIKNDIDKAIIYGGLFSDNMIVYGFIKLSIGYFCKTIHDRSLR